ncbi:polysaccharide biosynthesis protein [Enterococcus faecalis 13-SD-W-01]|nr:polysaccharide biosynthesis protein [Enterococcus faecalis 13-SD-W-01]
MKLIKNYLYNVGYQLFTMLLPIITVPYISRVLGREGMGINAYTDSIIQYFLLFGSIGINMYGNRAVAYVRDKKEKLSRLFWELLFIRIICLSISYTVFIFFMMYVNRYQVYYFYQSLGLLAAMLDISWFFMGLEEFKKTVTRNTVIKFLSLIAVFTLVKDKNDLGIYILILGASSLLGNLTLWVSLKKYISKPLFLQLNLRQHLLPTIGLFIPQIATQIYLVLNKTMLGIFSDISSVGEYENANKMIKIILAIVTATGTVMLPRVANAHANKQKSQIHQYLFTSFDFVSAICFPLAFGLMAIAPKFTVWFLGSEFKETSNLIIIMSQIIIWIGWSNVLGTQYLLPTNQTKYFTISVVCGALFNFLANILFIEYWGVVGAAYATVISEILVTFVQFYYVRQDFALKSLLAGTWKYLFSSILMFAIVRWLHSMMAGNLISFLMEIICGVGIYFFLLFVLKASIMTQLKKIRSTIRY